MEKKRIAVMQPYFFPYIGYFHLLAAVDVFVLYDNIQYTKKGWINRNRFLLDGHDQVFTIPLRKASDFCTVDQREIAEQFDSRKLLNRIGAAYRKAPFFNDTMDVFSRSVLCGETNLFQFIKHSLGVLCEHLAINTTIVDSSCVDIDHHLRGQEKVLAICKSLGATAYVNPIGGVELYDQESFNARKLDLMFMHSTLRPYVQLQHPFVAWLSILDVLMFNSIEAVQGFVRNDYTLIQGAVAS